MAIPLKENKKPVIIHITRRFHAEVERVFDAWLDKRTLGQWLFATPTGRMQKVEVNARVRGSFLITERRDGADVEHTGEYLEIDRPHTLAFAFRVPKYSAESTTVTLRFMTVKDHCELTLIHDGVLPEYEERTRQGWTMILNNLATTLGEKK